MNTYPKGFYAVFVYIAYFYFILFGGAWCIMSFMANHTLNYLAFLIVFVFAAQAIWKNKLANLIIGIIVLFVSILFFLNMMYLSTHHSGELITNQGEKVLIVLAALNIAFSGILVFSYLMFNKELK